jgi:hypothetical protein
VDAVAVEATPWTWEALAAAGCTCAVEVAGLTAPRVACWAPKPSLGAELRAALAWRIAAMRADYDLKRSRPEHQRAALVARVVDARRGACGSCGEPWRAGDCPLCNAARVAALRAEGVLGEARERPDPYSRGTVIRPSTLVPVPLDRTSPHWWACERGHDNWGLRASGCGPCEAARFGLMDLSGLAGRRGAENG